MAVLAIREIPPIKYLHQFFIKYFFISLTPFKSKKKALGSGTPNAFYLQVILQNDIKIARFPKSDTARINMFFFIEQTSARYPKFLIQVRIISSSSFFVPPFRVLSFTVNIY